MTTRVDQSAWLLADPEDWYYTNHTTPNHAIIDGSAPLYLFILPNDSAGSRRLNDQPKVKGVTRR